MQENSETFFVLDYSAIFERISQKLGIKFDAELARELGVTRAAVHNARAKGQMAPARIIGLCLEKGWSLDEIFTGHASAPPPTIEQALRVITDAGYSVRKGDHG